MTEQPSLLSTIERLRRSGEISADEYAVFKKELASRQRMQQRLEIIQEVARQIVERQQADPSNSRNSGDKH